MSYNTLAMRKSIFTSELDLVNGNLFKKMIIFTIPLIITTLLQLFYTSADLFVVSHFGGGSNSMGAVGANGSLVTLIVGTFLSLSVGANVVVAAAKGAGQKEKADKALHSSMIIALISGVFVGLFGFLFARFFLEWMNTPANIIDLATQYLQLYFLGVPFLLIYNFGSAILRALGDSKRPLYTLLITGVVNISLNLLFVISFHMDVFGVGLATIISEGVSAIAVIFFLWHNKNGYVRFHFKELRLSKEETKEILRIGIPCGLQSLVFSISNVFVQAQTNSFGEIAVDANSASSNMEGYLYYILNSFSVAIISMVAQNYGAKKKDHILKILKYSLITVTIVGVILGIVFTLLRTPLLNILIDKNSPTYDQEISIAKNRFTIICLTYFTCGIMDLLSGYLRGLKYSLAPTIITLVGCSIFRIIMIYSLFTYIDYFHTLEWLYALYPISWVITDIIYIAFLPSLSRKAFKKIESPLNKLSRNSQTNI
jgi:putative MATE family efflux protein